MVQRKFYLPETMYIELQLLAKASKKTITQVLREAVTVGLKRTLSTKHKQTRGLLGLAELGKRLKVKGPKDLARNHDKYLAEILEKDIKRIHDQYR